MSNKYKIAFFGLLLFGAGSLLALYLVNTNIAVLNPKGIIADKQRDLLIISSLLALFIVVPVFVMTFFIAWRYRETNTKAKYTPDWDRNRAAETVWWGVPIILILALSIITWVSSHDLDPSKPIAANTRPLTVQVVALEWKWLFIYPEQDIATVNYLQFPEKTPVNFEITADAPMNSFWIPQLGGQVYAMAGMTTKLHLMASEPGEFRGSSANLSGGGFAGMKFNAQATTTADFNRWVQGVRQSGNILDQQSYDRLRQASKNNPTLSYTSKDRTLYNTILMKYMTPPSNDSGTETNSMNHGTTHEQ